MSLYPVKSVSFVNKEYKKEWAEWVPGYEGKVRYCEGNYALDPDGTKTVWDGAGILMGWILPDGTFKGPDIDPTAIREYNLTFLRAAAKN